MYARLNWWIIFAVFTVHGLLSFSYKYLDYAARARPVSMIVPFLEEMTGNYVPLLLFPLIVVLVRRYPFTSRNWFRRGLLYTAVLVAFSVVHTLLNGLSRDVLFPLLGLGEYDYGIMRIRYWMEFPSDVFAFGLLVGSVMVIDYYHLSKRREVAAVQMKSDLAQTQLQNLRLQLQPHFLFNALNTISSVMYEDVRTADEMITRLSEFLRLTLSNSPAQEVRLSEELHFLELYLNIMRARFEDKLQVRLDIGQGIEDALVPQLILQPLIENSIRHGAAPLSGQVDINVVARRLSSSLEIVVRDHGAGLPADSHEMIGRGIGLSNTATRLNRLYGPDQKFSFANAESGGLEVSVSIPFRT